MSDLDCQSIIKMAVSCVDEAARQAGWFLTPETRFTAILDFVATWMAKLTAAQGAPPIKIDWSGVKL